MNKLHNLAKGAVGILAASALFIGAPIAAFADDSLSGPTTSTPSDTTGGGEDVVPITPGGSDTGSGSGSSSNPGTPGGGEDIVPITPGVGTNPKPSPKPKDPAPKPKDPVPSNPGRGSSSPAPSRGGSSSPKPQPANTTVNATVPASYSNMGSLAYTGSEGIILVVGAMAAITAAGAGLYLSKKKDSTDKDIAH